MFQREQLRSSLLGIGIDPGIDIFDELAAAYGDASRHYHDQSHVTVCLSHLARYRHLAERPYEIEVAIWFHDAIYDTRRADNEMQSAEWAKRYLSSENGSPDMISRVVKMINGTKSHVVTGIDAELMIDIDLMILGAAPSEFEAYDLSIRKEYCWVPEEQYRLARVAVLRGFIQRESIFKTIDFRQRYESQARNNLSRKIEELGA